MNVLVTNAMNSGRNVVLQSKTLDAYTVTRFYNKFLYPYDSIETIEVKQLRDTSFSIKSLDLNEEEEFIQILNED